MAELQEQARALGDPTRHAIFRRLVDADRPLGIAELNERFELNHNAIRQHLAKLVAAGLVVETTAPPAGGGRGRPRLVYAVDPAAEGRWDTDGPYERLSLLLLETIRSGLPPEEVGRRAAERFRVGSDDDAVGEITAAMARHGFEPELRSVRGRTEIVLHRCPFESSARADRETVCSLHLGIAEGLAAGTDVVVDELVAHDPRRAGCRLRVHVDEADGDASASGTLSLRGRPDVT